MRLSHDNIRQYNSMGNYRIICIDDQIGILKGISTFFSKFGYKVDIFTNHFEAIERMKTSEYDLLILDYMLDGFTGDKVVKLLREFNKELYIIFLTGFSDSVPPIEALEKNNVQGYCTKSSDFSQLHLLVKAAYNTNKLLKQIKRTEVALKTILTVVPKIYEINPIDTILENILEGLLQLIESKTAFIMVDGINNVEKDMSNKIFKGFGNFDIDEKEIENIFTFKFIEELGIARTEQKTIKVEDYILIPMINEVSRNSIGVMCFQIKADIDISIIEVFSKQASSAIINAQHLLLINIKNEELSKTYSIIKQRYEETINTLRLTVDAKDEYTRGHSDRVSAYSLEIAKLLGVYSEKDLNNLRVAGLFHDIGKIGTSDDILLSNNKLSTEEYNIIKKHPLTGANILSALSMFKEIIPIIKHHHESYDGRGYPDGLKGEEIPLSARIISIADAFDAMTTDRLYRTKLGIDRAILELEKNSGKQFDPVIVKVFVTAIKVSTIKKAVSYSL